MYNVYLFDFDGTLVDSMPTFISAVQRILDENMISYDEELVNIITPLGVVGTAEHFIRKGLRKSCEEIVHQIQDYILDEYLYHIQAKEHVISVLHQLKEHGAKLYVLTGSPHNTLDACLKRLEIYDLFENVWSCEDYHTVKSNPNLYVMVADTLGEKLENILFLDDNLNSVATAKAAGMKVCGVYDESSKNFTEEIKEVADYYIHDFSELFETIL